VRRVAAVELDLDRREIKVRGKGGRDRAARIDMRPRAGLTGTCGSVRGTSRRTCRASASRGLPRQWPVSGGWTCECNGGPKCRHDHRLKQHPKWKVDQPTPATIIWTTPAGRQYATEPTRYPI
jgi:hypothetical protein